MDNIDNVIIGAGISGLMMGHLLGENNGSVRILEGSDKVNLSIPISYFLHTKIAWLPTEVEKVEVHTNVWDGNRFYSKPNIGIMNDYSRKIAGRIVANSLKAFEGATLDWFLPIGGADKVLQDLYGKTEERIVVSAKVAKIDKENRVVELQNGIKIKYKNLISTIPLPFLLKLLGNEGQYDFSTRPIYSYKFTVADPVAHDACQVVYISTPKHLPYRAHLTGQIAIIESMAPISQNEAWALVNDIWHFTNHSFMEERKVLPGKFHPLPRAQRHALLGLLTAKYNIFCLGRYATWQHLVTDEVAKDAEKILEMIKTQEVV